MALDLFLNGLPVGGVYALIALAYSMIYSAMGLLNFAQGDIVMLGAFLGLTFYTIMNLPYPLAFLLAMSVAALVGLGMERFVLRPLARSRAKNVNMLICTIGLAVIFRNAALLIWGVESHRFPALFGDQAIRLGPVNVVPQYLFILAVAIVLMLVLQFFFQRTRPGRSLRAVAQDRVAASLMGVNVNRAVAMSFAISSALGAAAGVLVGPIFFVQASMGSLIGLKGFVAAVVGGLGNIWGAVVGGLVLGVTEALAAGLISSAYRDAIAFVALVLVLWLRPSGLFIRHAGEKT